MADMVAPPRTKRARSPSPASYPDAMASPLEVLLKRRRQGDWGELTNSDIQHGGALFAPPPAHWRSEDAEEVEEASSPLRRRDDNVEMNGNDPMAESSTAWMRRAGVERRRASAWERKQAPTNAPMAQTYSMSQVDTHLAIDSSPMAAYARGRSASQPGQPLALVPARHQQLSSSPVRHRPPSSTPFRADDYTDEERLREWGKEYAQQNSVLHALHLARVEASATAHDDSGSQLHNTPYSSSSYDIHTPFNQLPTPFRHARTPLDTPGLISSPYESSPALFSPARSTYRAELERQPQQPEPDQMHARYEETNRLLAELNVQRLRRHDVEPANPYYPHLLQPHLRDLPQQHPQHPQQYQQYQHYNHDSPQTQYYHEGSS